MSETTITFPQNTVDISLKLLDNNISQLIAKEFILFVDMVEALLEDGLPPPDWDILKLQSPYVRQITDCSINHYFDLYRLNVNKFANATERIEIHKRLKTLREKSLSVSRKLYREILNRVEQAQRQPSRSDARSTFSNMTFTFEI